MALTRITKGVIKPNENYDTHNINSTGIVTAIGLDVNGNGDISGNLSVGGVLTYEDVTSIDSVGIITAQSDIHVGGGVSVVGVGTFGGLDVNGDLDVDGHTELDNVNIAGVVTATSFVGGLPITNGADNRVITASSASAIQGEANLTFSGSTLKVNSTTGHSYLKLNSNDNYSGSIHFGDQSDDDAAQIWYDNYQGNGMYFRTSENTPMSFYTNGTPRLKITSDGQLHMGGGSGWTYASQKVVVVEPSNALGMILQGNHANEGVNLTLQNIVNANNAYTSLSFADDGGQIFGAVRGKVIDKNANTGEIQFHTSAGSLGQKVTINKDGNLIITRGADVGNIIQMSGADTTSELLEAGIVSGHVQFTATYAAGGANTCGFIFRTRHGLGGTDEKLRITSAGSVGINSTAPSNKLDIVGGYQALGLYRDDFTGNSGAGIELNFGRAKGSGELFNAARITAVGSDNTAQASQLRFSVLTSGSIEEKLRIATDGTITQTNFSGVGFIMSGSGDPTFQISDTDGTNQFVQLAHNGGDSYIVTRNNTSHGEFLVYSQNGTDTLPRIKIGSDGTWTKYYDSSSTVQAAFGGTGQINGITALPSMAGSPLVVGRDTGTTRSAHFGGHLQFDSGYGIQGTEFSVYGNTSGLYLNSLVSGDAIIFQTHNGSSVGQRVQITSGGTVNIGGDYTSTTSRLRINSTSYPETTEYLTVFKAGVANGNRFKNRYIKIRNNYTGSAHGGVPIVWEANADGSNNKAYGAVVTESDGDIRFLNAAATSEKAIGTDLLSTISEKFRIANDGIITNTATHPQIILKDTSNRQLSLRAPSSTNYAALGTDTVHQLVFYTAGYTNKRGTIHNNGQVRFGDECMSDRTSFRIQFSSSAGSPDVLSLQNPSNTDGQGINLGFWARNTNNAAIQVAQITGVADETQANSTQEGSLQFKTNGGASLATRMDIDQTNTTIYNNLHMLKASVNPDAMVVLQTHDTPNAKASLRLLARDNSNVNETCKIQAYSDNTASVNLEFHTDTGEHLRITRNGQLWLYANGGDNQFNSKRTGTTSSNGDYFYHLNAINHVDQTVGTLAFHRHSGNDDARFIIKTKKSGDDLEERMRIHADGTVQFSATGSSVQTAADNRQVFEIGSVGGVKLGNYQDGRRATPADASTITGLRAPNILDWGRDRGDPSLQAGDSISNFSGVWCSYTINGTGTGNKWKLGQGPHGGIEWLWSGKSAYTDASQQAQGGWNTSFDVDPNYSYMFITYVKRVSSNADGNWYVGTGGVADLGSGSTGGKSNPYWTCGSTSNLDRNIWHCAVHYVRSYHSSNTNKLPNAGTYRMSDGSRIADGANCNIGNGVKFNTTQTGHSVIYRSYLFYASTNNGTELHWAQPLAYKMDGTEPSLMEILGREIANNDDSDNWDG